MTKNARNRVFFLVVVPITFLAAAGYFYFTGGRYVVTENAYIKSKLVNISTDIDGRVVEVKIHNNQRVKKGDLLFRLDPEPAEIELMAARAELENVRQNIESLKSRYQQTLLNIDDAKERKKFLNDQFKRQEKLKQQGLGIEIEYDQAEHALEMGRRALVNANQQSAIVLAELSGNSDLPIEQHALFLTTQSKLNRAIRNLNLTEIKAPASGVLTNVTLEAGEYVEAGDLIFSIVESDEVWIQANLKESQLTHLKEGQSATIIVDAYPHLELPGTVSSLSPATGAEFAVLPPQNATGNWVKVVQRIPVRIDLTEKLSEPVLRAGMTTTVKIDTKHKRKIAKIFGSVAADNDQHQ